MSATQSAPDPAGSCQKHCGATGCTTGVLAAEFMCPTHWRTVPAPLRHAIENTPPGANNPYLAAAIAAAAHQGTRTRPPQGATKPVQLALFDVAET